MDSKPLTSEAIALTEKKMDMTLDDIINMSRNNPSKFKKQRITNKAQRNFGNGNRGRSIRFKRFMDSRSSLRQGVLAKKRTNFQNNQFPVATEVASKAMAYSVNIYNNRNRLSSLNKSRRFGMTGRRPMNGGGLVVKLQRGQLQDKDESYKYKPQTLDSLFANMKQQRQKIISQQRIYPRQGFPRGRGRFGS